jgi:hypothetical protein
METTLISALHSFSARKPTSTVQDFFSKPHFAGRKSLINQPLSRSPEPWVGDATALQSKQQTG